MVSQINQDNNKKQLNNINVKFSGNAILTRCGVSFNENVHNVVLIDGQNGCGKTTLMRVLTGIYFNEEIEFSKPINFLQYSRENIHYLPSGNSGLFYRNTVKSNLKYFYYFYTKKKLDIDSVVSKFPGIEILLDEVVVTLSSGQKKFVELVIAFTINSPILILDEPFTFLSPENVGIVTNMIDEYKGKVVIVSHSVKSENTFKDLKKNIKHITVERGACDVIYDLD